MSKPYKGICNVTNQEVRLLCNLRQRPNINIFNVLHFYCDNQEYCQLYKDKMCMQAVRSILPNNIIVK